jgi:hypothetical protein
MKAKEGDVIRFYFSEATGYTKERVGYSTEMVDIVTEEDGTLYATSNIEASCYLWRVEDVATKIGTTQEEEAIKALIANGWKQEQIDELEETFKTKEK